MEWFKLHRVRIILVMMCLLSLGTTEMVSAATNIWYIPHPDDETIGMADAIHTAVMNHEENIIILFTRGGSSKARYLLQGADDKKYYLNKEELEEARIKETLASLAVLGIKDTNVLLFDYTEGNIPVGEVTEIMETFIQLYPDGIHSTVAPEGHEDHNLLASTLLLLSDKYDINTKFYNVYTYKNDQKTGIQVKLNYPAIKKQALQEFKKWDPNNGRYAIGMHSVPDIISGVEMSEYEYLMDYSSVKNIINPKPIAFRILSNGVGISYLYAKIKVGVDFEISFEPNKLEQYYYAFYLFPDNIPFCQFSAGIGYYTIGRIYWGVNMLIADNFLVEFDSYRDVIKTRVGFEFAF